LPAGGDDVGQRIAEIDVIEILQLGDRAAALHALDGALAGIRHLGGEAVSSQLPPRTAPLRQLARSAETRPMHCETARERTRWQLAASSG